MVRNSSNLRSYNYIIEVNLKEPALKSSNISKESNDELEL